MKGILADHNVRSQFDYLVTLAGREPWADFWAELGLSTSHFEDAALLPTASDREVWLKCQAERLVLITTNRNQSGRDSLEEVIRELNNAESLPVFTIGDLDRLNETRSYADKIVESMLDYLLRIEELRGTGRLWLP